MITNLNYNKENDKQYQFIIDWLNKYLIFSDDIKYIKINDNYTVDFINYLYLFNGNDKLSKSIDIKFNKVNYSFVVDTTILTSLYNGLIWVGKNYFCYECRLNNLEGIADFIDNLLLFEINPLTSLNGLNFKTEYKFHIGTTEWLKESEQQHLIKNLLDENILWYDQFKDCLNDELKSEFSWFINTKSISKEE